MSDDERAIKELEWVIEWARRQGLVNIADALQRVLLVLKKPPKYYPVEEWGAPTRDSRKEK